MSDTAIKISSSRTSSHLQLKHWVLLKIENELNEDSSPSYKRAATDRSTQTQKYFLKGEFEGIYFTQREAECIQGLLQFKTLKIIAEKLNISHRTVESYIKNIKIKLGCKKKFELLQIIRKNEFLLELCTE